MKVKFQVKSLKLLLILMIVFCLTPLHAEQRQPQQEYEIAWATLNQDDELEIHLYFFWSTYCPHCLNARPFIESLPKRYDWLSVHSFEISGNSENSALYAAMAATLDEEARSVPAFLFCGSILTGFGGNDSTGAFLTENLERCHRQVLESEGIKHPDKLAISEMAPVKIPLLGEVNPQALSLPAITLILAGLDSFNPCAFFILLFLLSLMVHARSRPRMIAIGGTFVILSGVIYFLFMAAWLNVFMFVGQMHWVTLVAGLLAILIALINIKDYFWFRKGVSLGIPDQAKPQLFQRMRKLVNTDYLPAMMAGTVVLAVTVNLYELLCTAGLPMVFTRILTLNDLTQGSYYAYLGLYNLIYVIPLLVIVVVFAFTLGRHKLSEREGRNLKLLSGLMMLQLGLVLVIAPNALDNVLIAVLLLLIAVILTFLVTRISPKAARET